MVRFTSGRYTHGLSLAYLLALRIPLLTELYSQTTPFPFRSTQNEVPLLRNVRRPRPGNSGSFLTARGLSGHRLSAFMLAPNRVVTNPSMIVSRETDWSPVRVYAPKF